MVHNVHRGTRLNLTINPNIERFCETQFSAYGDDWLAPTEEAKENRMTRKIGINQLI